MTYFFLPLYLIWPPAALPAHQEVCLQLKSAEWGWPDELVVDIRNHSALFLNNGTVLVMSRSNKQSWFSGAADEMVREYCE